MAHTHHRVTAVGVNGSPHVTETSDYEVAKHLWEALRSDRDYTYAGWFELGFAGTPDAQWPIVSEGWAV